MSGLYPLRILSLGAGQFRMLEYFPLGKIGFESGVIYRKFPAREYARSISEKYVSAVFRF